MGDFLALILLLGVIWGLAGIIAGIVAMNPVRDTADEWNGSW